MQIYKPLIIAGPCSVESPEQLMQTARALRTLNINIFRAGLWKPRTRPGNFTGVGDEGLKWLQAVQKETGLEVCTEVASAEHVRKCLTAGIRTFWLGARTTANPFLVQEIADEIADNIEPQSLRTTPRNVASGERSIKVIIKNPICADMSLWIGAVERLQLAGVQDIILVLRGFATFEDSLYRNNPQWAIAAQMHTLFPQYRLLCDASHIAGDKKFVSQIAQKALSLGFDGLMIEVHNNPQKALSDSQQQLDPQEFAALLKTLKPRNAKTTQDTLLQQKRDQIDQIDGEILHALAKRMDVSREIGLLKKEAAMPVFQTDRWKEVLQKIVTQGEKLGLDAQFLNELYTVIHNASIEKQ